ncbi:carboxymuconolactone decarboxylase family protein [Aquincola sp. S2]|uniref:Carboxymuconolactone decarboxylase family protein n=1 Tax=Pseudaquabacterium terrae TaxID=2732868 RepID=A0ABX2EA46_9BURK|nr:carboxymuconolactone decarboxylase family protein [Aquabacterium terrae]NRF65934.1 carboxymuconolactone decarboxylase family protein [Aquabacterium terrae]
MHTYRIHTVESAPENSRPALRGLKQAVGIVPNLAATMAESPVLLSGFVGAFGNFHGGTFSGGQKQVLLLSNAVANTCPWAVAFHSAMALKEGVDPEHVRAIREKRLPTDAGLAALSSFTRALIDKRGHVGERDLASFGEAGFGPDQVLEVIAGLAVSVMANYAGNITKPAVEQPFQSQVWTA